jgi:hypothetical protein
MNTTLVPVISLNSQATWERWESHSHCDTQVMELPGPGEYFMTWCSEHEVKGLVLEPEGN